MASVQSVSSGSEDDRVSDAGEARRKMRRRRGKRSHRKALESPASERPQSSNSEVPRRRRRTNSACAPPAPCNTTSFLLEDREVREEEEVVELKRARSTSVGDMDRKNSNGGEDESSTSSDGELSGLSNEERRERLLENEFEDEYREAAFQKYAEMSHDELARTMVEVEATRDKVAEQLERERLKNAKLQEMIKSTNQSPVASPTA